MNTLPKHKHENSDQGDLLRKQAKELSTIRGGLQLHEKLVCSTPINTIQHLILDIFNTFQRYGGECGRVGSDWCANGDDFVAGSTEASPGFDGKEKDKRISDIRPPWFFVHMAKQDKH